MKATAQTLHKLLDGSKQYKTPIYQRNYSWNIKECEVLLKDIKDNKKSHNLGTVVYNTSGVLFSDTMPTCLLIDGQQRITTISLLLKSIVDYITESNLDIDNINADEIRETYLINRYGKGDKKNKLFLNKVDNENYDSLLNDRHELINKNSKIYKNYLFFLESLSEDNIELIFNSIKKLWVIEAVLEEDDDAQQIFESLNSTGLDLTQSDLIRNFILMTLPDDDQTSLYERYWSKMEEKHNENFTSFIRTYIAAKKRELPSKTEIYNDYKNFVITENKNREELLKDLYKYSNFYETIFQGQETNLKLKEVFNDFNRLKINYVEPTLLFLYNDYNDNRITSHDLYDILITIRNYLVRRNFVISASRDLSPTFFTLMNKLLDNSLSSKDYRDRVVSHFILLKDVFRFPKNNEFKESLYTKDLYNSKLKKYILEEIENFNNKEKISCDNFTIEHIIPQNEETPEYWKTELGEDWENIKSKYLHTIGNLTLTGYNSELSDKSFTDKKNHPYGFDKSPLNLNTFLKSVDTWNLESIKGRVEFLSDFLLKIWDYPTLESDIYDFYKKQLNKYSIEKDHEYYDEQKDIYNDLYKSLRINDIKIDEKILANSIDFEDIFEVRFTKKHTQIRIKSDTMLSDRLSKTSLNYNEKNDIITIFLNKDSDMAEMVSIIGYLYDLQYETI